MAFLEIAANSDTGAYEITNSCQFNTDAYCEFTPSSGSGSTQFTYSAWVKNCGAGDLSETGMILSGAGAGSGADNGIQITAGGSQGKIQFIEYAGGSDDAYYIRTNRLFRDPSAWMHVVLIYDAPDGTAGDRMRLYINGTRETSFSHEVQLPQDRAHAGFTRSSVAIRIGSQASGSNARFDGYLADVYFCDGQNYEPSEFGETDDNGVWIPKKADVSFGTNGFKLEFKQTGTSANASGIGADTSGNDNHFSVSGLAATNITSDSPTNNFCTLNSIHPETTGSSDRAFSEGNTLVQSTGSSWFNAFGNIGIPNSGKWYYEYQTTGSGSMDQNIGFVIGNFHRAGNGGLDQAGCYTLYAASNGNGYLYTGASNVNKGTDWCWTHDDIMMVAIDCSSRNIWYGKNGTWLGSGDPANDSNEAHTVSAADFAYGLLPGFSGYHTGSAQYVNFGNPAYANSSSQADAAGYGDFEYDVPTGFYSLCTKNLAKYG